MKPSDLIKALLTCIEAKQPAFVWGSPGIGKSDILKQITKNIHDGIFTLSWLKAKTGFNLIDIRAILLDPVDLRGIPVINNGTCKWSIPSFLPSKGSGIIFLDELNAAPLSVQAACYQLILDRKIGEYTLPDGYVVIAAGNRETDRVVTNRMPTPLANRFVHFELETDLDDWINWAIKNKLMPEVISFIQLRPELLNNFDPKTNNKSFCSPRTLFFLSNIFKTNPDQTIQFDLTKGLIGEGVATEFIAFLKLYNDLPNMDIILKTPEKARIPNDPSTLYAVCTALSYKANDKNFENIIKFGERLEAEFLVLLTQNCIKRNRELTKTTAYINYVTEHASSLIG